MEETDLDRAPVRSEQQEDVLQKNLSEFVKRLDVQKLLPHLAGTIMPHHLRDIEKLPTVSQANRIVDQINRQGCTGFQKFYDALVASGHDYVATLLEPHLLTLAQHNTFSPSNAVTPSSSSSSLPMIQSINVELGTQNGSCLTKVTMDGQQNTKGSKTTLLRVLQCDMNNRIHHKLSTDALSGQSKEVYRRNSSRPKGLVLIINNREFDHMDDRHGTDFDVVAVKQVFEELAYDVVTEENLTADEMLKTMRQFALRPEHGKADSVVVVLLSHGGTAGRIFGVKCIEKEATTIETLKDAGVEIEALVNTLHVPKLVNKPRMIFIQACRGDLEDPGVTVADGEEATDWCPDCWADVFRCCVRHRTESLESVLSRRISEKDEADAATLRKIPTGADCFIGYASNNKYKSYRRTTEGSWFIQCLCEVIAKHAKDDHIDDLMTKVRSMVSEREAKGERFKQIPNVTTSLTKKFYFFPGYYT